MSDGCCCGATKSNPCVCMKKGITKCSKSEPKCPCYAEKDKKTFEKAWDVVKEENGSPCPVCGEYTKYSDCPKDAPDFVCPTCHETLMDEDDGWREETEMRRKNREIAKSDDAKIARWLKNTSNAGTPYDDYDWDGKVLTVYSGDNVERYTLADLREAGAL